MQKFEILATFPENVFPYSDDQVGCGYQEAHDALDAVIREISGPMVGTEEAESISAGDDEINVTAYRCGGEWEVHVYIDGVDKFFTIEAK